MPKPTTKSSTRSKKNNVDALNALNDILAQLDKLSDRRRTWEDGLQRAATRELYAILEGCLGLYGRLLASTKLKTDLSKILKNRNVKQTAGSSLQLKVVRYVFGECSQEYTYARTIVEAHKSMPKGTSFSDWLEGEGGPTGVKKGKVVKARNTEALIEEAARYYETATPLSLQNAAGLNANKDANHSFAVALVRIDLKDPTKREIVYGCNNVALVNRVLEQAGKTVPPTVSSASNPVLATNTVHVDLVPFTVGGSA